MVRAVLPLEARICHCGSGVLWGGQRLLAIPSGGDCKVVVALPACAGFLRSAECVVQPTSIVVPSAQANPSDFKDNIQ